VAGGVGDEDDRERGQAVSLWRGRGAGCSRSRNLSQACLEQFALGG
jgi:hypothetical protein